jgi:hypothetical protein
MPRREAERIATVGNVPTISASSNYYRQYQEAFKNYPKFWVVSGGQDVSATRISNSNSNSNSVIFEIWYSAQKNLHVEPRPLLLRMRFPLPFLAALPLDAPIDPPQFERGSRSDFLHSYSDVFHSLQGLSVRIQNLLLRCALLTEHVSVAAQEYVISLVV